MVCISCIIKLTNPNRCNSNLSLLCAGLPPQTLLLKKVARYVERILGVFGLLPHEIGSSSGAAAAAAAAAGTAAGQDSQLLDDVRDFRTNVRRIAKSGLAAAAGSEDAPRAILAECDRYVTPQKEMIHQVHREPCTKSLPLWPNKDKVQTGSLQSNFWGTSDLSPLGHLAIKAVLKRTYWPGR